MSTILRQTTPKARKAHMCECCFTTIQPGETYSRDTSIWDGRVGDWVQCLACDAMRNDVWREYGDWDWGIGPDEYQEWSLERVNVGGPVGEAACAYLARREISTHTDPHPIAAVVVAGAGEQQEEA